MVKEGNDLNFVSNYLNVQKQNIKKWILLDGERRIGRGRKILDIKMEKDLAAWWIN